MRVKKYGNRRLYDTERSAYITLDELAESVRDGEDVEVVDAKSGRDLTQQTLAHVILESRGAAKLLPVPLLVQLIRMGDDALAEFFGLYMGGALELYLAAKGRARALTPFGSLAQMPFVGANAFARLLAGWGAPEPEAPRADRVAGRVADEVAAPVADQVAELRRELEELKAAVRRAAGGGEAD